MFHFHQLQVYDAHSYVHQETQKVKLGDAPTCFHLGLNIFGFRKFGCWALISFSFLFKLVWASCGYINKVRNKIHKPWPIITRYL